MLTTTKMEGRTKIIAFILIIVLAVTMLPIMSKADSPEVDINTYVNKGGYDLIVGGKVLISTAGNATSDGITLKNGQEVLLKYYWNIPEENMQYITEGAFFTFDLPESNGLLKFSNIAESAGYKVMAGNKDIGILTLDTAAGSNGQIKVTLDPSKTKSASSLDNGWVTVKGNVSIGQGGTSTGAIDNITIPIEVKPGPGQPGYVTPGNLSPTNPRDGFSGVDWGTPNKDPFSKTVTKPSGYNSIATFNFNVNNDNYISCLENATYDDINDVMIIDELQENIEYSGNLKFTSKYYMATGECTTSPGVTTVPGFQGGPSVNVPDVAVNVKVPTQMSKHTFYSNDLTKQFEEVKVADPTIGLEKFKALVKNNGALSWGLYQDKTLVIYVGDIPKNDGLLTGVTWGKIKEEIEKKKNSAYYNVYHRDSSGKVINTSSGGVYTAQLATKVAFEMFVPEVKDATLMAYANLYDLNYTSVAALKADTSHDDKVVPALGFSVSFNTTIKGDSREISNEAIMYFGSEEGGRDDTSFQFTQLAGGASFGEKGDVRLLKVDGDTLVPLEGTEFKIERYDKDTKTWIQEGEIRKTDDNGYILYKRLPWGKYRITEVKFLNGYIQQVWFSKDNGYFELANPEDVIEIIAYNYKENVLGQDEYDTDDQGDVLGEQADPDAEVLGEEAKTSDPTNLVPLLLAMLAASIIFLITAIRNTRKE